MDRLWPLLGRLLPARYRPIARSFSINARRYLLTAALQNVGYGIVATTLAIHLKDSGFSESVVGDVEGALALSSAVMCLALPPLVASLGYRRLMVFAGLALGLARLGQAYAPTAAMVVMLGLVFGLGEGTMQTLSTAFLSQNAARGGRTHLYTADFVIRVGASVVGSLVGGLMPALFSGWIGGPESFRLTIVVAAALMVGSAITAASITDDRVRSPLIKGWSASLRGFRSWHRVWRLLVPEMLIAFGAALVIPFMALFLKHRLGAEVSEVGVIQAVSSVAMAIAALATPRLARRFGLAGTVVITELASLPFLIAIPLSMSLPTVAVLFWVRGMLMNMSWPVYNQLSMEGLPAHDRPLVAGWVRFGWSIAWLGGSTIGGRLMEHSYTTPYFYAAGLYLIGATATFLLLRHIKADDDEHMRPSVEGAEA